jgi:type I restriction enzyme S subunit
MIANLKPYPSMKDSGLPWLGEVPEHWGLKRGKNLFRCIDVRSSTGDEELLTVSSERGVVPRRSATVTMFKAESYVGHKLCWPGDLVINSLWAWARGLGVSQFHGIVSTAYGVYRLRAEAHTDSRFIHELVRSTAFHWELQVRSKGVWTSRLQLTDESFLGAPFPLPAPPEQSAIVRFLDHADRRIRRYILAKQKLIKLLEEQKQAIIHRAVTSGLDPNVRLKSSGVEWLGNVPEHWKVLRLKTLARVIDQGVSPQAENRLADDGSWGVLKAGCVNRGVFRDTEHKRLPADFPFDPNLGVEIGDVLVSRASGSPQLVGSVGRVQSIAYRLILSDKTFRPVFNTRADSDFMVLAMNSRYYRQQVEQAISGAEGLASNLPSSSLRAFAFAVPPVPEQRTIVEHVRGLTSKLLGTISRAFREIDLLREYRTRLIADVVTGKLDVREAATKLVDEAEEPGLLDNAEALAEGDEKTENVDFDAVPEETEA